MAEKIFPKRVENGVAEYFIAGMWVTEAMVEGRLRALCLADALKDQVSSSAKKERELETKLMENQGYSPEEIDFERRAAAHQDKVNRGYGKSRRIRRQRVPRVGLTL